MQKESLVGKKLKNYSVIRKLGAGMHSVVYEGINALNKQRVAIKAIPFEEMKKKPKLKELVQTEINVLKSCNNDNVIKHIDSFMSDKHVFIVTEFCNQGDVQEYLNNKQRLNEEQATDILKQILNGFKGLHEVKAMHRDFKLANLLLHNKIIKIADLGFAKQLQKQSLAKTQLGTGLTMAPQVLDGKPYGMYADIWSIGVVYYQMLYGRYPFYGHSDHQIRRKIEKRKIEYFSQIKISEDAKDFIERCLTIDPKLRISWSQLYFHPLITNENSIKYSLSVSKVKLQANKKYYLQNQIEAEKKFIYPEKQAFITAGEDIKQMKAEEVKEQSNLELLQSQNEEKKKRQVQIFSFEQIMLKKRNNIMFMFKYFIPKIAPYIHKINANHSMSLFFICKKTSIELQNFVEEINEKRSHGNDKSSLKYFFESQNCFKLLNLLLQDIDMIKMQCSVYKQGIDKSLPIVIQTIDITKWQTPNIQALLHQIFDRYWYQIAQNVPDFNINGENTILEILKALEFYYTTDEVSIEVFTLLLQTMDYKDYRAQIIRKIYDSMVNAN